MSGPGDVAPDILAALRPICLGMPEAHEEPAWVGVRWRIRTRTFAHVLTVDPDRHLVYAKAAAAAATTAAATTAEATMATTETTEGDEPMCVLTFRSPGDEIEALVSGGHPFFKASWGVDVVGMVLDDRVDWEEVAELLTESYCLLAPKKLAAKKLAARVDRPPPPP